MKIVDFILNEFEPLSLEVNSYVALNLMEDFELSHIPFVDNGEYLGVFSHDYISHQYQQENLLDSRYSLENFHVLENQSIFEVIVLMKTHQANIVPVLNGEHAYLGYITQEEVIDCLSRFPFVTEPSAMIVVKTSLKKYSASEIAKIVESNNAKAIGIFIVHIDQDSVSVAIKVSGTSLNSVVSTFERFGYQIVISFFDDLKQSFMKDRLGSLMKYLEV